ncbi:MAG: prolipoprotein diacylglyceryl transferase [Reichenbachiella sp.]
MHPVLFNLGPFTIQSYGFLIALGTLIGYFYLTKNAKEQLGVDKDSTQSMTILFLLAAVIGGKFFFYLERPVYYFGDPGNLFKNLKNGFVFYGSLIFVVITLIWYLKKKSIPILPMLDILAFSGVIIHGFGRLGCFFAGCCYGKETDGSIYVVFSNQDSFAPTDVHLHPTQLYSVLLLITIFIILWMFKRHQRFEGQLFFLYIILYAIGRGVIEIFRGDLRRGFIIEDWISHSQMISIVIISIVAFFYIREYKKNNKVT